LKYIFVSALFLSDHFTRHLHNAAQSNDFRFALVTVACNNNFFRFRANGNVASANKVNFVLEIQTFKFEQTVFNTLSEKLASAILKRNFARYILRSK